MKQAQNARNKQRGRSPSRKGGGKSSGPGNTRSEPRVRGNPKQLLEKYKNQAREARQAGDRVTAEYYYQFADHYQRIMNDMRGPGAHVETDDNDDNDSDDVGNRDGGNREGGNRSNGNREGGNREGGRNNNRGGGEQRQNRGDRNDRNDRNDRGDDGEDRQPRRSRGGRRPRPEGTQENGATGDAVSPADPAQQEQPVEVHPELDLDGMVAGPAADAEEKPKRRRAPVQRKRAPRKAADAEGGEGEDAPKAPEDNAAA
ncbi:DUF4167 domain-containing protein [Kordiimonas sp.]|uniref:DUF4167 domain-containing protein n=1 Tax=Kordiimonas sp. TaxID=1970157 RepID=UPI003B51D062